RHRIGGHRGYGRLAGAREGHARSRPVGWQDARRSGQMRQAGAGGARRPSRNRVADRGTGPCGRPGRDWRRSGPHAGSGRPPDDRPGQCPGHVRDRDSTQGRDMNERTLPDRPLKLAIVAGEESGDLLGADMVEALRTLAGREVRLSGVGGRHLGALGLSSIFDAGEIALMGLSAVLRDLPRLMRRIRQTPNADILVMPDFHVTMASSDVALSDARMVVAEDASAPVINYVSVSVGACAPETAQVKLAYLDRTLCLSAL